jgi:hypothetical protein
MATVPANYFLPPIPEGVQTGYMGGLRHKPHEVHVMTRLKVVDAPTNTYRYETSIKTSRPPADFTPRVIPVLRGAMVPLEAPQVLCYS